VVVAGEEEPSTFVQEERRRNFKRTLYPLFHERLVFF
jgi:hypothetical protein